MRRILVMWTLLAELLQKIQKQVAKEVASPSNVHLQTGENEESTGKKEINKRYLPLFQLWLVHR